MASGREKDRKLHRRRRRKRKLQKLKSRLRQTKDPKEREILINKIKKISIYDPEGNLKKFVGG
jgi:hypothetical protein